MQDDTKQEAEAVEDAAIKVQPLSEILHEMAELGKRAHGMAKERVREAEQRLREARDNLSTVEAMINKREPVDASISGNKKVRPGFWKDRVFDILSGKGDGLRKAEIVDALNLDADTLGKQSLSSALMHLKRTKSIIQRDGKYCMPD